VHPSWCQGYFRLLLVMLLFLKKTMTDWLEAEKITADTHSLKEWKLNSFKASNSSSITMSSWCPQSSTIVDILENCFIFFRWHVLEWWLTNDCMFFKNSSENPIGSCKVKW
jgi:hypothetical protein